MKKILILSLLLVCANLYAEEKAEVIKLEKGNIYSNPKFIDNIRDSISVSYVVDAETIEKRKYNSVGEILRDITVINTHGNDLSMRGQGSGNGRMSSSNYNSKPQLYVDGVLQNFSDSSNDFNNSGSSYDQLKLNIPIYTVNVKDIEKIEVIPGGNSVLYGDGAANGVINITTKKIKETHGRIEHRYGSYKNHITDLSIGTSIKNTDINLSYRKNKTDGYDKYFKNNTDVFSGKTIYNINDNDYISSQYNFYKEKTSSSGTYWAWVGPGDWDYTKFPQKTKEKKEKKGITLNYSKKINENNKLDLLGFYNKLNLLTNINNLNKDNSIRQSMKINYANRKIGLNLKDKIIYNDSNSLVFGLGYIKDTSIINTDDSDFTYEKRKKIDKNTFSIFASNTYKYKKFNFTQGIRYENIKYNGHNQGINIKESVNNWHGNLGINYLYSDTGNIYGKYEIGMTSPNPEHKFNLDKFEKISGSNKLKSEMRNTFEIGWNDYIFNSLVSANIFYSRSKDLIKYIVNEDETITPRNIGETREYGFDIKAEQKFDKITFRESYSYINAKILKDDPREYWRMWFSTKPWPMGEVEGKKIANVPAHRYTLAIDYDITKKLGLTLEGTYNADAFIRNDNTQKKGRNFVVNFRANYKPIEDLDIYVGINNWRSRGYQYGNLGENAKYYVSSPEKNYYAGFSYKF